MNSSEEKEFNFKKESKLLKKEAKEFLDKYDYYEIINATEQDNGSPELLEYLHKIFLSIIEDWIQDYVNKRKRKYIKYLKKSFNENENSDNNIYLLSESL